ncbi:MAG: hypothetical protein LUQ56_02405 [Methylococcaceae bacterium]|nr:hypothetical protein [Methylococcaceae bacterium]MDD1644169.1 hypothetical protein [Methylococcaceae bacterium]
MIIDEEFKTAFGRKDLCLGLQGGAEVFDTAPDSFAWIILRRTEKKTQMEADTVSLADPESPD